MNGLLHRLAARAAGRTTAVRSDARLPFGEARAGWAEALDTDPGAPPSLRQPASGLTASAPTWATPTEAAGAYDFERSIDASVEPRAVHAAATSDAPIASRVRPDDAMRPDPALPPGDGAEPGREARPPIAAPVQERAARALDRPRPVGVAEASLMSEAAAGAIARPTVTVQAASSRALRHASDAALAEPHEVHIHIGRIDVTAVQEAPAPRPVRAATAPRTAPMSLDQYFTKRGRA